MKTKFERGINGLAIKLLPETEQEKILLQEFTLGRLKGKSKHIVSLLKEGGINGLKVEKQSILRNLDIYSVFGYKYLFESQNSKFHIFYGEKEGLLYATFYGSVKWVICVDKQNVIQLLAQGDGFTKMFPDLFYVVDTMLNKQLRTYQKVTFDSHELNIKVIGKFRTAEEFDALNIPNGLVNPGP